MSHAGVGKTRLIAAIGMVSGQSIQNTLSGGIRGEVLVGLALVWKCS